MALKGNLRDFSITQLLNLINLARKTGTLTVERPPERADLCFREGKLVYASLGNQHNRLDQILLKTGRLTTEQTRLIQTQVNTTDDKELGLWLINTGYVTQKDILQSVRQHMLEIVYQLFTWTDGKFRFEPNQLPPPERITVPISLENVIIEGTRRMKEWEQLQDELPNLDMALRFTDRPGTSLRNINLSIEEWRVISFINPRNTIRQIAQATNMSEFQIRKIVYGMLQAGLVELVRPEGREVAPSHRDEGRREAPLPPPAQRPPAVKRSVVMRLIDRIKQL
ncbi:MAG: DUF4388 domain-containing protein [Chloroflexi bacterium]|nr:MAG: DUF4388 domain-containing protein [Chloroflexota bacterium]